MERFDCPVCGIVFEDEDGNEVTKKVMDHMSTSHPDWGTKKPSGTSERRGLGSLFKRGR